MTFQYQRLAEQLSQKIYQHELQPQQKLSSLREFARQQKISLSTAQQCYELLEAKGLIYVKPKSGYFVSSRQYQSPVPESPKFESMPRRVSNLELQNQIQTASIQSHLTPLGAIQLSPHLIPVDGLRRSLQRALKHCQPEDFCTVINKDIYSSDKHFLIIGVRMVSTSPQTIFLLVMDVCLHCHS